MTILAIDTSCDDTCIAIIEVKSQKSKVKSFDILSNVISSQVKLHARYGGVYPTLAKREHQKNLTPVLIQALKGAKLLKELLKEEKKKELKVEKLKEILKREDYLFKELKNFLRKYKKPKIDLIAVTVGPGLEPCLWTGVNFVKALSKMWKKPIIPINHIEAHIYANFFSLNEEIKNLKFKIKNYFPAICLVVSGGHTQLILMKNFGKYKILGETRDDAAGECFDKVARILGLGYPGGPIIEKLSKIYHLKSKIYKIKLPRPMIYQKNFDFSFSGLKTAVLYDFENRPQKIRKSKEYIRAMATEIQQAIIDVLIEKTIRAVKKFEAKSIILGGGVASNKELRKQFKKVIKKQLPNILYLTPDISYCTDNAVMIGLAAYFHYLKGESQNWQKILVNANLRI